MKTGPKARVFSGSIKGNRDPSMGLFTGRFSAGAARVILPGTGRSPRARIVRVVQRTGRERAHTPTPMDRPVRTAAAGKGLMSEDERHEMVRTVAEAHAGLREIALRLRRRLPSQAAAAKAAVRAEQEAFRLKIELQRLVLADPDPAAGRGTLPEIRQGGKVVDIERLRRGKDRGGER